MYPTNCEYCGRESTHSDWVPDPSRSEQGVMAYREIGLCLPHAIERGKDSCSRVRCMHHRLDAEGCCITCGQEYSSSVGPEYREDPIHFAKSPFMALCGTDKRNQGTTQVVENVTCGMCLEIMRMPRPRRKKHF